MGQNEVVGRLVGRPLPESGELEVKAIADAALGRFNFKGKLLTLGTFFFPCALLLYASVSSLPLSLLFLTMMGGSLILIMNLTNALIQTTVPDHLRGRVMSIYAFNFFGSMPIGGLLAGIVANAVGAPLTLAACALILLAISALIWFLAPQIRAAE